MVSPDDEPDERASICHLDLEHTQCKRQAVTQCNLALLIGQHADQIFSHQTRAD